MSNQAGSSTSLRKTISMPPSPKPKHDPVDYPPHYNSHPSGIECIQITEGFTFNLGCVIKYIWRAGLKSECPVEDLKKARWYIEREINRLERQQSK